MAKVPKTQQRRPKAAVGVIQASCMAKVPPQLMDQFLNAVNGTQWNHIQLRNIPLEDKVDAWVVLASVTRLAVQLVDMCGGLGAFRT